MKYLRQYIRQAILESQGHQEKIERLALDHPRQYRPLDSGDGVYHKDWAETEEEKTYKDANAQQDYVNLRRDVKR